MAFGDIRNLTGAYGGAFSTTATTFNAPTPPSSPSILYIASLQALSDVVISATSAAPIGGITGLTAATVPAGQIIYGRYVSITISSGTALVYYAPGFA